MNWDAIGAVAEVVGALAVVATLLYLAVQIRQNTISIRAATFQNIMGTATSFNEGLSKDPDLIRIFRNGVADLASLSGEDAGRFHFQILGLVRRGENFHYQSRMGLLEDEDWEGLRTSLLQLMSSPGSRAWWKQNTSLFNSTLRAFIEREVGESSQNR